MKFWHFLLLVPVILCFKSLALLWIVNFLFDTSIAYSVENTLWGMLILGIMGLVPTYRINFK